MPNEVQEYKGQILGVNDEGFTEQLEADSITESLKVISTDQSDVHNKKGFSISGIYAGIANSSTVNFAFKTPTVASGKIIHLKCFDVQSSAVKVRTDLYEAPTNAPTAGTDIIAYNHNRIGTPVASAMQSIKSGVTFDGTGATMLNWQYVPKNLIPMDGEWLLQPNTWYCVLFTNQSGAAVDLSFYQYWIEE